MKMPGKKEAEFFIKEAGEMNTGPWVEHSYFTAKAAAYIADACSLIVEAAYVMGLLHDIGRREGRFQMRHTLDGYKFLSSQGYEDAARICLSHSFHNHDVDEIFSEWDCTRDEYYFVKNYIEGLVYNDYDRLIQLCDNMALSTGFCILEKRMIDVQMRYGVNRHTIPKWKATFEIKSYFEKKIGASVYSLLPGIIENTFEFLNKDK